MHEQLDEAISQKNFLAQKCLINFAFCPNSALMAQEHELKELTELIKLNSPVKGREHDDYKIISEATRFFYICYSLKFGGTHDYFYFQTFSKIGESEMVHSNPLYGFYKKEDILKLVVAIDEYFSPNPHDKQIFDNVTISVPASASFIINLMTTWTTSKLMQFANFYKKDRKAQIAAVKAKEIFEKIADEACKKEKKPIKKNLKKRATKKVVKKNEGRNTAKNKSIDKPIRKRKSKKKPDN